MRKGNRSIEPVSGTVLMLVCLMAALAAIAYGQDEAGEAGQQLFLAQKCNTCHSVPTVGIEAKTKSESMRGADLVNIADERTPEWMAEYLTKKVQLDDADHKKEFKGSPEELDTLVTWILEQKE